MAESPSEDALALPPVPLASGQVVDVDGVTRRIVAVELVVRTEDGGQIRLPLTHRHGAWWPPEGRGPGVDSGPPIG